MERDRGNDLGEPEAAQEDLAGSDDPSIVDALFRLPEAPAKRTKSAPVDRDQIALARRIRREIARQRSRRQAA